METAKFWETFDSFPQPDLLEIDQLGETEETGLVLPREDYPTIQKLYRMLFTPLFLMNTGLARMNTRLAGEGFLPVPETEQTFYQRYDTLGLQFFYLRSFVHVERLHDYEAAVLQDCLASRESIEALRAAGGVVRSTWRRVLQVAPDQAECMVELFPDVADRGFVPSNAIVVALASRPDYDENGAVRSRQAEDRRISILAQVSGQLPPVLSKAMDSPVAVIPDF